MPRVRRAHALLALSLAAPGCVIPIHSNDTVDDTDDPGCRLLVSPAELSFDIAASDAPSDPKTVTLKSECPNQTLTLFNLTEVRGDRVFRVVDDALGPFASLSDGETLTLPVVFDPPSGGSFEARIPLGVSPIASPGAILLHGVAAGPSPILTTFQADDTRQWCSATVDARVDNAGPDMLVVRELRLGDRADCDSFVITEDLTDAEVEVGARLDLPITFRPVKPGPHACPLELVTDVATAATATLRGDGLVNSTAEERFVVSDGSGANLLLLFDDGAADLNGARSRLSAGLPTLLSQLRERTVDFRITAASTADACTVGPFTHGTALNSDADLLALLRDNLFDDSGTDWSNRPLELQSEVASRTGGICFAGWYEAHEPLHTIIVAARDDASGRTPTAWVNEARTELPGSLSISVITPSDSCATPTDRLTAAARATSGLELDLCATSWAAHWLDLAQHTGELRRARRSFTLAAPPLAGSIQVAIDGLATTDFTIDDRVVTVAANVPDGSDVLVRYTDAGTCGSR